MNSLISLIQFIPESICFIFSVTLVILHMKYQTLRSMNLEIIILLLISLSSFLTCISSVVPFPLTQTISFYLCSETTDVISSFINILVTLWLSRVIIVPFIQNRVIKIVLYTTFFIFYGILYILLIVLTILQSPNDTSKISTWADNTHLIIRLSSAVLLILSYLRTLYLKYKLTNDMFSSLRRRLSHFLRMFLVFIICFVFQSVFFIFQNGTSFFNQLYANIIGMCLQNDPDWFFLSIVFSFSFLLYFCYSFASFSIWIDLLESSMRVLAELPPYYALLFVLLSPVCFFFFSFSFLVFHFHFSLLCAVSQHMCMHTEENAEATRRRSATAHVGRLTRADSASADIHTEHTAHTSRRHRTTQHSRRQHIRTLNTQHSHRQNTR